MWILLLPVAYLIGTFPSASIVARARGIDIRTVGSGNPGASNVARTLGWRAGVAVFILDTLKGVAAAGLGFMLAGQPAAYLFGAAAVAGHVFPVWQRFHGGKGVATGGGIFAITAPLVFVTLVLLWYVISKLTHKASVASIIILVLLPILVGVVNRRWWEVAATIGIVAVVMARHVGNIKRLVLHEERALSR